jgi:tetratricopeptide (TPR) repeat protein
MENNNNINNVTFVTAYLKTYESDYDETKSFEKRLELFMKIVELNVNICLFISPEYKDAIDLISNKHKNLIVIEVLSIEDLEITKIGNRNSHLLLSLPDRRNCTKDSPNYMFLMNSKIEFIKKTIDVNPFNNDYFCWFDFSLPYIFKNMESCFTKLKWYSESKFISEPFIAMPGCWNKCSNVDVLKDFIYWRFCGGFFIGDKNSLLSFYDVSIYYFEEFLNLTKKLVWEVNYWAWLELMGYKSFMWYLADHNDTIINIPTHVII